jgi:hypothetical protein
MVGWDAAAAAADNVYYYYYFVLIYMIMLLGPLFFLRWGFLYFIDGER